MGAISTEVTERLMRKRIHARPVNMLCSSAKKPSKRLSDMRKPRANAPSVTGARMDRLRT